MSSLHKLSFLLSLITGAWLLATLPAQAEPLKVVASFSILGDMVQTIGGDQVQVTTLVGPDGDAHVYQPTPADVRAVAAADVLVVNGLGFEGWLDRLLEASGSKARLVVASEGVVPRQMEAEEDDHGKQAGHAVHEDHEGHEGHAHGQIDPHAWQDLANGLVYAGNISRGLAAARPDQAATFAASEAAWRLRLASLDAWVREELATIAPARRRVISSHDAFGYFADAYRIEFLSPAGLSTDAEPTARDVARLVRQMKAENVRAVFIENMADPRLVRQIARDAGGIVGGTLYADALSAASGPAPTYEAMFRYNVATLKKAMLAAEHQGK